MFDKELFISLCETYGVEFSDTAEGPMIYGNERPYVVTENDIYRVFAPRQLFFEHLSSKTSTKVKKNSFYLPEDYAMAC